MKGENVAPVYVSHLSGEERAMWIERLQEISVVDADAGCWEAPSHYYQIEYEGRTVNAGRVACALRHGDLTDNLYALHSCDNPYCVNPAHLHPGTAVENRAEYSRRGARKSLPSAFRLRLDRSQMYRLSVLAYESGIPVSEYVQALLDACFHGPVRLCSDENKRVFTTIAEAKPNPFPADTE